MKEKPAARVQQRAGGSPDSGSHLGSSAQEPWRRRRSEPALR